MSTKKYKIGKHLRDILLSSTKTFVLSDTSASIMGEIYTYPKIKRDEILKSIFMAEYLLHGNRSTN